MNDQLEQEQESPPGPWGSMSTSAIVGALLFYLLNKYTGIGPSGWVGAGIAGFVGGSLGSAVGVFINRLRRKNGYPLDDIPEHLPSCNRVTAGMDDEGYSSEVEITAR